MGDLLNTAAQHLLQLLLVNTQGGASHTLKTFPIGIVYWNLFRRSNA
jgi:hypothetical protein